MFGEKIFVGYSNQSVDSKNRLILPTFTKAEAGDTVILIPEEDKIAIYPDSKLRSLQEKIDILKGQESIALLEELRSYCESAITIATVDQQRRISLTHNIEIEDNNVELLGSGDRILMCGKIKYPSIYKKNRA